MKHRRKRRSCSGGPTREKGDLVLGRIYEGTISGFIPPPPAPATARPAPSAASSGPGASAAGPGSTQPPPAHGGGRCREEYPSGEGRCREEYSPEPVQQQGQLVLRCHLDVSLTAVREGQG